MLFKFSQLYFQTTLGFGFTQETFVGIEQADAHSVGVGFLSGSLQNSVLFTVDIDFDTAGKL